MEFDIKTQLETYIDEEIVDADVAEFNKILSINEKVYTRSRDYIITNENYNSERKVLFCNFLDVLFQKKGREVRTSKYEQKPYVQTFFKDFLDFLNNNKLSQNELKVCLAIYSILDETNTWGNVLMTLSNGKLAKYTKIDQSNVSKAIKSLESKKVILKDNDGAIYLNYSIFFRGDQVAYDLYAKKFDALNNSNIQLQTTNAI